MYFLAYKLKIDIDEIRSWPYLKTYKWLIAIKKIMEKMNAENEKAIEQAEIKSSLENGEHVIIESREYT